MDYSKIEFISDVHCSKHAEYTPSCINCRFFWEQVKGANKRKKEIQKE